jgi:hypothetical protein
MPPGRIRWNPGLGAGAMIRCGTALALPLG